MQLGAEIFLSFWELRITVIKTVFVYIKLTLWLCKKVIFYWNTRKFMSRYCSNNVLNTGIFIYPYPSLILYFFPTFYQIRHTFRDGLILFNMSATQHQTQTAALCSDVASWDVGCSPQCQPGVTLSASMKMKGHLTCLTCIYTIRGESNLRAIQPLGPPRVT